MRWSCVQGNWLVNSLVSSFGKPLTGLILTLVAFWITALIVLPQITMVNRAFTYEDRGGEAAQLFAELDRAYADLGTVELDLNRLKARRDEGPGEAGPTGQTPGVPTAPSLAPTVRSPALPSPSLTPSASPPSVPSPSMTPSPGTGASGKVVDINAGIAQLEARKKAIAARIADLEEREREAKRQAAENDGLSLKNFTNMSRIHATIFGMTLLYAACVTVLCFAVCYPVAYAAAQAETSSRAMLLMLLLVIPYAINELLRIFAWVMILEKQGLLNAALDWLGLIDTAAGEGFRFVASNGAVFAVMVYAYILFMVFPIYNTIETLDRNQIEAARDLGASVWKVHSRVVLPHAKPGIAVGAIMTFMVSAGSIAVPEIVGRGLHPDWFSQVIYRAFFEASNWNYGAAYSLLLLGACIVFILAMMSIFKVGIREIAR
jgi:spermidine/putrescine transport system permease protein